jgi:hypothetical protein
MSLLKDRIRAALASRDLDKVARLAQENGKVFSILIGLSYDKEDVLAWRAIEAMGAAAEAVAAAAPSTVRTVVQRLLWSIRDESGGIGWSAPEMLGEIAARLPKDFGDIPPLILSFNDEEMFRTGILWAMGRIAESGAGPVQDADAFCISCLASDDPAVRGYAAWALVRLKTPAGAGRLSGMTGDSGRLRIYSDGELVQTTVGEVCRSALAH